MKPASIVHLDADAFFVSVEQVYDPGLLGKKVAVGGRQRGIISSASYEARACGVYTPMPTTRAMRVCPDLILVRHTPGRYGEYSRRLFDLCEMLTPQVERASIDEGYLDLGPCGFATDAEVENAIRCFQRRIADELKIGVSFGIASNKLVAAIASKLRKPRGFTVVPSGSETRFLAPLGIGRLPGIGQKTEEGLRDRGIVLVSDLFTRTEDELRSIFGERWRGVLSMARGEDERAVESEQGEAKSYSQQETFGRDILDFEVIVCVAKRMIDDLMPKVRTDQKCVRTITLKVRYADFSEASAGHSVDDACDLEVAFYVHVAPLLKQAWAKRRPLRLLSVRLSGVEEASRQMEFFDDPAEKRKRLALTMDALKARHGSASVVRGTQINRP